jgi:hypothetical protein
MAGRLRLKGQSLLSFGRGAENAHQLALRSGKSYPTVKRFVDDGEADKIKLLDLKVLPSILLDGQEMTVEQMMSLTLGDLFEYMTDTD